MSPSTSFLQLTLKKSHHLSGHLWSSGAPTNVPVTERTTKHQTKAPHPAITPSAQWTYSLSAQSAMSPTSTGTIQAQGLNQIKAIFLLFTLGGGSTTESSLVALFKATLYNFLMQQKWHQEETV